MRCLGGTGVSALEVSRRLVQRTLYLSQSAVDKYLDSGDETAVVRRQKHDGFRNLIAATDSPQRHHGARSRPTSDELNNSRSPSVSIGPGLTAFTRIRRALRSVVQVRAKDRTAALVAE